MIIIPAIDLKGGKVVRLFQGREDQETVYSRNPVTIARHWKREGAQMIHVVDLDGAFTGTPKNLSLVKDIVKAVNLPVEFGGGVRSLATVRSLLEMGVRRVVLGTKAVDDKEFLTEAIGEFADSIIVSIDAKNGKVLTQGWVSASKDLDAADFACSLKELGLGQIIYTDTSKDGTLRGPNIAELRKILIASRMGVIASGGVSCLEDIQELRRLETKGLTGVIIGKALYEGKFTIKQAKMATRRTRR